MRRRGFALALLLLGIALLGLAGVMWNQYLRTKQVPLPLVREVLGLSQPLYSFSVYGVLEPQGVAVSPDGQRIYVTEGGGDRLIYIFDPDGKKLSTFFQPDSNKSNRKPTYVAVSPQGLVYVTDSLRPGIQVFSADGKYHATINPEFENGEGWRPLALTFDREGNLYVTDIVPNNHRVVVLDPGGAVARIIEEDFSFPNGIAVDGEGRIFVADSNHGVIKVFDRDGRLLTSSKESGEGQSFGLPRGLAIHWDGRLAVVDTFDHSVKFFSPGIPLRLQLSLGRGYGNGDGQFGYPGSLAIQGGRVYVTDRVNNRIQVWF